MDHKDVLDVLFDLCEYCLSDELTLTTLQERMKKLDQFTSRDVEAKYQHYPFFHNACLSKGVTLEIVEYILDKYPEAASLHQVTSLSNYQLCPLHIACYNQYCSSIIKLLMEKCPAALSHHVQFWLCFRREYYNEFAEGLPLHYYVATRKTNVDIDIDKVLLKAYPQALQAVDGVGFTPLHAIVSSPNEDINNLLHIINNTSV